MILGTSGERAGARIVAELASRFAADDAAELGDCHPVLALLEAVVGALASAFRSRASLVAENLGLRQQLAVLRVGRRPRLRPIDRAFWVVVSRVWSRWVEVPILVFEGIGEHVRFGSRCKASFEGQPYCGTHRVHPPRATKNSGHLRDPCKVHAASVDARLT